MSLRASSLLLAPLLVACGLFSKPEWERPPPPARDAPVVAEGALGRADLENGLRVLVLEDPRLPRVVLSVSVRRGEAIVDPAQAGLADFTAELMKRGAGGRDSLGLARAVDEIGAALRVSADWDSVTVSVAGLSRDLDRLVEILADVVLRPRFDAEEARKARDETLAALERAREDPETLASWNLARTLYAGHRYGLPAAGTPETVARLDAETARGFHRRTFVANDAILGAAGDVRREDLLARARAAFGDWSPGPVSEPGPPPPAPAPEATRLVIVDRPDLEQAHIRMGSGGIARADPERLSALLMNSVLGGSGFSSRLMASLRSEEGLTYGVGSGFSLRRSPGPFAIATFTRVAETRRAIDLCLAELARARSQPPDEGELRDARALAVGRFALGLETSSAVMRSLVDLEIYGLAEDSLDTYRGRIRAVTVDDTARAAERLLHPDRLAVVVVGPAEVLAAQLEGLGPIEVVPP